MSEGCVQVAWDAGPKPFCNAHADPGGTPCEVWKLVAVLVAVDLVTWKIDWTLTPTTDSLNDRWLLIPNKPCLFDGMALTVPLSRSACV